MDIILQRLKSKTYWAAFILSVLTILEANTGVLATLLPLDWQPYTPLAMPLAFLVIREFTNTALADKS